MKTRVTLGILLALALMLPVALMVACKSQSSSASHAGGIAPRPEGPCDIYAAGGTPCVAAHSTTRALSAAYNGPLYQVMRQSDGRTRDIGLARPSSGQQAGGYVDAAAQDEFCANTVCFITVLFDQSGKGNHLYQAPPGTFKGPAKGGFNTLPIADMAPITINGHKAYGVYIMPGMGFRNNDATGLAVNDEPEGIYYVIDGTHYDSGCCFDYGNSSANGRAVGTGTMETVYFGTATAWGSGEGPGPWIMADFEAGLFSGYNAKRNPVPTIDSWRFVTAVVNGGGGNKWDLRGGNAQVGGLTTFYSGVRPGTPDSSAYFPMNKKGGILMGNGGDNGNGSSGTFYEGVMTSGYPTEATTDAVQANIVAAKYDVQRLDLSRLTTFTPGTSQDAIVAFTNTTGAPVDGVQLSLSLPSGWSASLSDGSGASRKLASPIPPGAGTTATFKITSPRTAGAGFLVGKAQWTAPATGGRQTDTIVQRVRNVFPIKINEVRFNTSASMTDQFLELYNASNAEVDISNWRVISTHSQWAPVPLAIIPPRTRLGAGEFYLLGLSGSGLAAPASPGATTLNVRSTTGLEAGQQVEIEGETRTVVSAGTAAEPLTTVFIPVSTGPWLTIPPGATNLPVTSAAGFEPGQKIGIDLGGQYEIATVTTVGKAATQTTLSTAAVAGATSIKVAANSDMSVGDTLTVDAGGRKEFVTVKRIVSVSAPPAGGRGNFGGRGGGAGGSGGGEVELTAPLTRDHMLGVDVSDTGTGISFTPGTKYPHKSGDAVQALGSGITIDRALSRSHNYGAPVIPAAAAEGYQGAVPPDQWFGAPFSTSAGSIALMDESGKVVVDAMVFGSRQSSSSANGTIASPELAVLEGEQGGGGCIVVAPSSGRGGFGRRGGSGAGESNISVGRFPDGADTDSNCTDFLVQTGSSLAIEAPAGATNIKVASTAEFSPGHTIAIDSGTSRETVVIASTGTAGGTTISTPIEAGATLIPVANASGFNPGQTITIGSGEGLESAVVASVSGGRRGGAGGARGPGGPRGGNGTGGMGTLSITAPLKLGHNAGTQISGSGITLREPLTRAHPIGVPVVGGLPTPKAANQYNR